jgi:hypothetical protein
MHPQETVLNIRELIKSIPEEDFEECVIELAKLMNQCSFEQVIMLRNSLKSFRN